MKFSRVKNPLSMRIEIFRGTETILNFRATMENKTKNQELDV
jgi:hypothetical protein